MTRDPYLYPDVDVLRNKEDIRDAEELARFERLSSANRMETLPDNRSISADGYRALHGHIFQDVYAWAGQDRTVALTKGDSPFCFPEYIDQELRRRFEAIQRENDLRDLSAEDFASRAAEHVSELNAIHPFREGNGRTQRAFLEVLGERAGHDIDLERIEPGPWHEASIDSFRTRDYTRMRAVIFNAIAERHHEREGQDEARSRTATNEVEAAARVETPARERPERMQETGEKRQRNEDDARRKGDLDYYLAKRADDRARDGGRDR